MPDSQTLIIISPKNSNAPATSALHPQPNLAQAQEQSKLHVRSRWEQLSVLALLGYFVICYGCPVRTLAEVCIIN